MTNYMELFENKLFAKGLSDSTIREYKYKVSFFEKSIEKDMLEVTSVDVECFIDSYARGREVETRSILISALFSFYSIMEKFDLISVNPMIGIEKPKLAKKHKEGISKEQCMSLIKLANNKRDRAMIMFMFNTGCRISEVSSLTLKQFEKMTDGEIKLVETKGGKPRSIYLSDKTINAIEDYLENRKETDCDRLFVSTRGTSIATNSFNAILKRLAKKSELFDENDAELLSNHKLRHGTITFLLNNGTPLQEVSHLAGHSDVSTTMKYWDVDKESTKKAMANIF